MALRNSSAALAYDGEQGLSVGHRRPGDNPVYLSDDRLRQHTLFIGKNPFGADGLVMRLLAQQVARGGGFVVLDRMPDRDMRDQLAYLMALHGRRDAFRLINVDNHPTAHTSHTYNPVYSGTPRAAAERLALLFDAVSGGAGTPGQSSIEVFARIVAAVRRAHGACRVSDVVHALRSHKDLGSFVSGAPEEREGLAAGRILRHQRALRAQRAHYGSLAQGLAPYTRSVFGKVLDVPVPEVQLQEVLRHHQGLYVPLPVMGRDAASRAIGNVILSDLLGAMSERATDAARTRAAPPFLVFVNDFSLFASEAWPRLLGHAPAANVAFLVCESSLRAHGEHNLHVAEPVLQAGANTVFLTPYAADDCMAAATLLSLAPAQGPGGAHQAALDELKGLRREQAVMRSGTQVFRLNFPCMPALGAVPVFAIERRLT